MTTPPSELLVRDEVLCQCYFYPSMHPGHRLIYNHSTDHICTVAPRPDICFTGSTLWIGKLLYRIDQYEWQPNSWRATWPD